MVQQIIMVLETVTLSGSMTATVTGRSDYYPFGMRRQDNSLPDSGSRYLFCGKENQDGGLDFGARMYDVYTGRWTTPDPMAEKYYSYSTYN